MEKQRNQIIKQIEFASQNLIKTKKNKEKTLEQFKILEEQIKNRKELLNNINQSISILDEDLIDNKVKIDSLENSLGDLQDQYKNLLRFQMRKKMLHNNWISILSSMSLQEAFTKWRLFKQFEKFFETQSQKLISFSDQLSSHITSIENDKIEKQLLLESEKTNSTQLLKAQKDKDKILKSLSSEEIKLKKQLDTSREERERLNKAIENIILKELEIVEKEVTITKSNPVKRHTDIAKKKGQLAMPVTGKITSWFGKHDHPTIKNIQIENNGIDIKSQVGASVRSVHDGKIISISFIPGHQNMIMVQHGSYFAVYSKIKEVAVQIGQEINTNDVLGTVYTNSENNTILHFEIWNGKDKENPSQWLKL